MKSLLIRVLLPAATIVLASACSGGSKDTEKSKLVGPVVRARGEIAGLQIALGVESVDVEKRVIALKSPSGTVGSYQVTPLVKRLAEIHPGDTIHIEYSVIAMAEIRDPYAEEEKAPVVFTEMQERRPSSLPPGGMLSRSLRAVTAIDALNVKDGTLEVKGPLGGQIVAQLDDPSVISFLKVGQKIVVSFSETLILSVEAKK